MAKRHKKIKKKSMKIDFDTDGRRRGIIMFRGKRVRLIGLTGDEEEAINEEYNIDRTNNKILHYQTRLLEPGLADNMKILMEDVLAELYTDLYTNAEKAATDKVKRMAQRSDEWFGRLTLHERNALKLKVMTWLMFVDLDDLYMEIFKEATDFFKYSKSKSTFTGEEIGQQLEQLEQDYLSLKKKPKCLDTALRIAQEEIVGNVFTDLLTGESSS